MTESEDWHALRKRVSLFMETDLGKLYRTYENAMINCWRHDMDDTIGPKKARELDDACRAATNVFVAKLMELAGV